MSSGEEAEVLIPERAHKTPPHKAPRQIKLVRKSGNKVIKLKVYKAGDLKRSNSSSSEKQLHTDNYLEPPEVRRVGSSELDDAESLHTPSDIEEMKQLAERESLQERKEPHSDETSGWSDTGVAPLTDGGGLHHLESNKVVYGAHINSEFNSLVSEFEKIIDSAATHEGAVLKGWLESCRIPFTRLYAIHKDLAGEMAAHDVKRRLAEIHAMWREILSQLEYL